MKSSALPRALASDLASFRRAARSAYLAFAILFAVWLIFKGGTIAATWWADGPDYQITQIDNPTVQADMSEQDTSHEMQRFYRAMHGLMSGALLKALGVGALLLGVAVSVAARSAAPAIAGFIMTAGISFAPDVVDTMFGESIVASSRTMSQVSPVVANYEAAQRALMNAQEAGSVASLKTNAAFLAQASAVVDDVNAGKIPNADHDNLLAIEMAAFEEPQTRDSKAHNAALLSAAADRASTASHLDVLTIPANVMLVAGLILLGAVVFRSRRIERLVQRLSGEPTSNSSDYEAYV